LYETNTFTLESTCLLRSVLWNYSNYQALLISIEENLFNVSVEGSLDRRFRNTTDFFVSTILTQRHAAVSAAYLGVSGSNIGLEVMCLG